MVNENELLIDTVSNHEPQADSFENVKEVASRNISEMLRDLQDFETAIQQENISEIYRIYQGRLHKELKETSNKNHEIDELLVKKLDNQFIEAFPFMKRVEKVSPTMNYYQINTYYHERPTIVIDASVPEIFVVPQVLKEWEKFKEHDNTMLTDIEQKMDELDAKAIAAKTEIAKLDEELEKIQKQKKTIEEEKNFFNRLKIDEGLDEFELKEQFIHKKKAEWQPYIDNQQQTHAQKEQLEKQYQVNRLKHAIVTKEMRLIKRYFTSVEEMHTQFADFLNHYLNRDEHGGNLNE